MRKVLFVLMLLSCLFEVVSISAQAPEWQIYNTSNSLLPGDVIFNMHKDNENHIWVGTDVNGCAMFNDGNFEVFNMQNGLSNDWVRSIAMGPDNTMWFGTAWGLCHYTGNSWEYFLDDHQVTIYSIAFSDNGAMWVGTGTEGVYKYYQNVWTNYSVENSILPANYVNDIEIINDNEVWLDCFGGGLVHIVDNELTVFNTNNSPLDTNTIWDIYRSQNNLWISTQTYGVYKLNLENFNWTHYTSNNSGLSINNVKTHLTLGSKEIFGTWGNGISILENENWLTYSQNNSPLPNNYTGLKSLQPLNNNSVAIGTSGGLAIMTFTEENQDPWEIPEVLPTNMTIVSEIRINNEQAQEGDVLAAFETIEGEEILRGKSVINPVNGVALAMLMVYFQNENASISFKIWDSSTNTIHNTLETVQTQVNGIVGSYPNELFVINGLLSNPTYDLSSGWNLISFTGLPENNGITSIFSELMDNVIQIKNATQAFIPGFPGNTLSELCVGSGYWLDMTEADVLEVGGQHTNNPIELNIGWNLIGYNLLTPQPIESVLSGILQHVIEVKGVDGLFTPENPLNTLTILEPKKGYWINVDTNCTLIYMENEEGKTVKSDRPTDLITIKPNSMSLVTKITLEGQNAPDNSQIKAYVGDELRGSTNVHMINDQSLAYLQIFSDEANEQITFKLSANGQTISSTETMLSQPGASIGNYASGAFYQIDATLKTDDNTAKPLIEISSIYPNPFNPTTNIKYTLGMNQKVNVSIFNVKGQLIRTLLNETQNAGEHQVEWNGKTDKNENAGSGVYFCKVSGSVKTQTKKMIMMK